ncbi:MAG: SRPBCC family protein [bacterium]|nr:SRPBCC family protein [bacterium]
MQFLKESVLPASVADVFAFHERPDAFERLQPPWERVEIITPPTSLAVGTRVELKTRVGPFWIRIVAEHVAYEPNERFEDIMVKGPFAKWHHQHLFLPHPDGCLLRDEIEYAPPLGWLGRLVDPIAVRPKLQKLFDYRHEVTRREVLAALSVSRR